MSIITQIQKLFQARLGMALAAFVMAASVFLSRFMGLLRDKIISYYHGAGTDVDVYFTAFVVPDFLNYLLAGGYFSITLIPLLSRTFEDDRREEERTGRPHQSAWQFFASATSYLCFGIVGLTAVAWIFAPELAHYAAPGFDDAACTRLTHFLRIILPAQIFFMVGSCFTALLYLRRQFAVPALTPLIYNGCIIAGGMLGMEYGMEGFCWGVLVGAFLGSFVLPVWAVCKGGFVWAFSWNHPLLKTFFLLALPLMLGQSITVLDEQFIRIFGSMAGEGAVSLLNYARRIMLVPVAVVAQVAGVVSYPFLAALLAKNDMQGFYKTLSQALSNTLIIIIPITAWMCLAAEPTMRLIFQQGAFSAAHTAAASPLLLCMLLGVPFWGVQQLLGRAFYAAQDTLRPVIAGTLATLVSLPCYYLGAASQAWWGGALGVAVAGVAAVISYTIILAAWWGKRFGTAAFAGMGSILWRVPLLCVPALAVACSGLLVPVYSANFCGIADFAGKYPLTEAFLSLSVSGTSFVLSFLFVARMIFPALYHHIIGMVLRRRG